MRNIFKTISFFLILIFCCYSCATEDIILTEPINGYVTFKKIDFTIIDEEVYMTFVYICHNNIEAKPKEIAKRLSDEFKDITKTNRMIEAASEINDSIGKTLVIAQNYYEASTFIYNVTQRLKAITSKSSKYPIPIFNLDFSDELNKNKAVFKYSNLLFEPNALICFQIDKGNLDFSPKLDSQTLTIRTTTNKYVDFLVSPEIMDSISKNNIEILSFTYDKPPLPWYSWTRIKNIFIVDNENIMNVQSNKKVNSNFNFKNLNFDEFWIWAKDQLIWMSALAGILGFVFYYLDRRKKEK